MKRIKKGTRVLIKAEILRDCIDERPKEKCGYVVCTSRCKVMVNPEEIIYTEVLQ